MTRLVVMFLLGTALISGGELLAAPEPDVVLYGLASWRGEPLESGDVKGTVGGMVFSATFQSENNVDYYVLRIPVDNSVGYSQRPGTVLIDDPQIANRTVQITINDEPVHERTLVLSEGGTRRLDISVRPITAIGIPAITMFGIGAAIVLFLVAGLASTARRRDQGRHEDATMRSA